MGIISLFKKRLKPKSSLEDLIQREIDFVKQRKSQKIGLKSSLMEFAALNKGLKVTRLNRRVIIVESDSGKQIGFTHMNGLSSSILGKRICDRKHDTRNILKKNKISVVKSQIFNSENFKEALEFVNKIGFPIVVKPTTLSRGRGITTNIQSVEEFRLAWNKGINAYKKNRKTKELIIEKHFQGEDYRFFVVGNKVISVTHRKRANITGDGKSNILELIRIKNNIRKKNQYLANHLIPENIVDLDILTKNNLDLDYIPNKGESITLRSQSNLSAGGDSIDVTDIVHPDFFDIAVQSVKVIPGVEYAGVDIIAQNISNKPNSNNHIVGEVEFSPAPIAHFPLVGKRRDMAGAILEHYLRKEF